MILSIWCKVPHVTSSDATKYWIWRLRCGTGGAGIWLLHVIVKVPSLRDTRLLSWFLMSGKKGKKLRRKQLAHGYWAGSTPQNHITSHYHPQVEFILYPAISHHKNSWTQQCTLTITWKIGQCESLGNNTKSCSWLNQNNYHWGNNTVMFSFLNIWKECLVLQDGLKTVSRVSQATEDELIDCSLDHQTAQKVINFFDKDCIQIWI